MPGPDPVQLRQFEILFSAMQGGIMDALERRIGCGRLIPTALAGALTEVVAAFIASAPTAEVGQGYQRAIFGAIPIRLADMLAKDPPRQPARNHR